MATTDWYRVHGRVVDSGSGRPLAGLHVRAYDKDPLWDDALGNDHADQAGAFTIAFLERDFRDPFEGQPEIYVVVYGDDGEEIGRTDPRRLPDGASDLVVDATVDGSSIGTGPRITDVRPSVVLPGSIIEVHGAGFGNDYGGTSVTIGGTEALVLTVDDAVMQVRVPPGRGPLDPLVVEVATGNVEATGLMSYGEPPDEGRVGTAGAPATFAGADEVGAGLAPTGRSQRVLIVMCNPADKSPTDGGLGAADERQRQIDVFEQLVNPGFLQLSHNQVDFDFDYTEWLALPDDDDSYFWRAADITDAQDELDNLPDDATTEEVEEAEAAVEAATKGQNLMQRSKELYHDALKAAADAGWNLADYAGIMLCIATDHLRGQASGAWNEVTDSDGDTVTLGPATNLWIISYNAHWGRRIHELAHAIASGDLYSKQGYISDASIWDMMGSHNRMPLFSGYNLDDKLGWYSKQDDVPDPEDANVLDLEWTSADEHNTVYTLRAHDAAADTQRGVYHLIRLEVFPGLTYFVQVRQEPSALPADLDTTSDSLAVLAPAAASAGANPAQLLFDTRLQFPGAEPAHKGGVIVTKVVDDTSNLNQKFRKISLLSPDLLQAGDEVVDAARRLTIRVEAKTDDRPLTYLVRVKWVDVATADPNGLLNLRVRPWDSSYQTNDIWVDSEANGWDTYATALEPGTNNPLGNGDPPWVDHWNRIYARVHNFGVVDANDVQVTFYVNNPPAIGDSGTWVPHGVRTIATIPAGSSAAVFAPWYPVVDEHTCLKVSVETQLGETDVGDNDAQENVVNFDTAGSSPHQPVLMEAKVQNPLPEWSKIELHPQGLRPGWEATIENGWVWLPPLGEKRIMVTLFTDLGRDAPIARYPWDDHRKIPPEISFVLSGGMYTWYGEGANTPGEAEHLASIGGVQITARARRIVDLNLEDRSPDPPGSFMVAHGSIEPVLAGVGVTVEVTGPDGRRKVPRFTTDDEGRFVYDSRKFKHTFVDGEHSVRAFIVNDRIAAETESVELLVEIENPEIR